MPFCTKLYSNRKSNLFGFSPFFIFTKCDRLARSSNIGEKCRRPQYHLPIQSNGKFKSHFLTNFIIGTCEVHGPDSIANLETSQTLILVPSNPNPGYSYSSKSFWASALIQNLIWITCPWSVTHQTFLNWMTAAAASIVNCIIQWGACFIFPVGIRQRAGREIYYWY